MHLFSNLTQKHIIVAQQLIGTRRTSSQDMVSTVVVLSHLIPSISSLLGALCSLGCISITKNTIWCLVRALKKSTISNKNSVLYYVVMLLVLLSFLLVITVFVFQSWLHCNAIIFPSTSTSLQQFHFCWIEAHISPVPPHQSLCHPCTSLLICLSSTECPGR